MISITIAPKREAGLTGREELIRHQCRSFASLCTYKKEQPRAIDEQAVSDGDVRQHVELA
jgi:hypothetical protein